jgi:hypothetical protein
MNLEQVTFDHIDGNLKEELEEDIEEFEMNLSVSPFGNNRVKVIRTSNPSTFVLKCGFFTQFKFPEGSRNQIAESAGPYANHRNIKFTFDYHRKQYELYGYV